MQYALTLLKSELNYKRNMKEKMGSIDKLMFLSEREKQDFRRLINEISSLVQALNKIQ